MHKTNKPTVTIGIAAYNEEQNIAKLLEKLLRQKQSNFTLSQIIVASDKSTDKTVEIVRKTKSDKICLIDGYQRLGQAKRQNQIFRRAKTDFVVLLNADVLPKSKYFISQIITPMIRDSRVGLVGAQIVPSRSQTLVGKILDWNMHWKNDLYRKINHADNVYLCHGRARAFSKKLYRQLRWPAYWSEDAYSYLRTIELGIGFAYAHEAQIVYQSPQTIPDHMKQSLRFLDNRVALSTQFTNDFLDKELKLPTQLLFSQLIKGFLERPFYMTGYLTILTYCHLIQLLPQIKNYYLTHQWEPSTSTKTVTI